SSRSGREPAAPCPKSTGTGGESGSAGHRPIDRLLLLGREGGGRAAALELLHVDARVVAPLDGGDDDARAGPVEEGERGRLVAAGVLVGVVADDRRIRDGAVDAPIDPRQARRDLV